MSATTAETEKRIQTVCLLILSAVAIALSLRWLQNVLIPVVLAFFLTIVLNPIVNLQVGRLRLPRSIAVANTVFLGFLAMAGLSVVVSIALTQFTENVTAYQTKIEELYKEIIEQLPTERLGLDPNTTPNLLGVAGEAGIGGILVDVLRGVLSIVSQAVLVLIFLFFLLVGKSTQRPAADTIWGEIDARVKRYLIAKTLLSILAGIVIWIILAALGVPLALTFGLLVFLLNFVPNIGSIIATVLPLPIVLVNDDISFVVAVLAIALPAAVQFALSSFVEPRVLGNSLDLHPATILLALIFWGTMWGIVGMLLAAPITAIIRILLEKLDITAPIARLLAGRRRQDIIIAQTVPPFVHPAATPSAPHASSAHHPQP